MPKRLILWQTLSENTWNDIITRVMEIRLNKLRHLVVHHGLLGWSNIWLNIRLDLWPHIRRNLLPDIRLRLVRSHIVQGGNTSLLTLNRVRITNRVTRLCNSGQKRLFRYLVGRLPRRLILLHRGWRLGNVLLILVSRRSVR